MDKESAKYHMRAAHLEILDQDEISEILKTTKYMTISMVMPDGEPYTVILSHGYDSERNCIYFHTGHKGRKFEALRHQSKVCAIALDDQGYVMGKCRHRFRSAMVFGTVFEVDDPDEKLYGLTHMFNCLEENPEQALQERKITDKMITAVSILRLDIETITAKRSKG